MPDEEPERPVPKEVEKADSPSAHAPPIPEEDAGPIRKLAEDVAMDIPFATAIYNFFVREGRFVKHGWFAFLFFSVLFFYFGYLITSWSYSDQVENMKDQLSKSDGARMEAERDRDKYQLTAQNAD